MEAVKSLFLTGSRLAASVVAVMSMGLLSPAFAEQTPAQELESRLAGLNGVTATFVQEITDTVGTTIERSEGTLYLARPQLRWETVTPFAQTIVADRGVIRIYDPDLEQVTVRKVDGGPEEAPLLLLTQRGYHLADQFDVTRETGGEISGYVLYPRTAESLFNRLEVYFRGSDLATLVIVDPAEQRSVVRFEQFRTDVVIQSSVFDLDLPPDTDVVEG